MKDIIGQEIEVGAYVAFSTSSSADLTVGRITGFTTIKSYHAKNSGALIVTTTKFSKWVGYSRIHMHGKVLVLSKSQIPSDIRKALDEAYERKTADKRSVPRRGVRSRQ